MRRAPVGAQLDGRGRLAFCPCLGTPLAVRFSAATVAPPHDVVLRDPVLEVFGVPVAWAPAIWLRSAGRAGLLPPDVQWRGQDGFFAGGGFHLPWRPGDVEHGVDVRAGGYADGGAAVDVALRTSGTATRVTWDHLHGDGLSIAALGSTVPSSESAEPFVDWQVDALRGARAVLATSDVFQAAEPFDRATASAGWRSGDWLLGSALRTAALRGGDVLDPGVGGPLAVARRSGDIGPLGEYDATVEAGQIAGSGHGATSFARGQAGLRVAARVGPIGGTLALRSAGDVSGTPMATGADGSVQARGVLDVPLERRFGASDEPDPWVHTTALRVEVAAAETQAGAELIPPGPGSTTLPEGGSWVAAAGWANHVDRLGGDTSADLDAVIGEVGTLRGDSTALRVRGTLRGPWAASETDLARVLAGDSGTLGGAWMSRLRVGNALGAHVVAHVAEQDGTSPVVARALVDPVLEPALGFLTGSGWSGGVSAGIPLGSHVTVSSGVEADLDAGELVAETGALELHDPCHCVAVRLSGAHRVGRDGLDVWLSVDVPISRP